MHKTILIITDNLPEQINGVVTTYKNIETYAIMDGYRVVYISPRDFSFIDCPFYKELKIAFAWQMGKKIEAVGANYIHIATEGPVGLSARKYLSKCGYRYNTAYHTKFPEGIKKLLCIPECLTWPYVRWFHKHSARVLTTTESMVRDLRDHGFDGDLKSWTRGVDRDIFNPSHRKNNLYTGPILLCVGRVSKEKNLDDFCKLQYPNAKKIMVGDGPYRKELEKKYPDVEFVGFKTGLDLAKYYAMADVFVFPSKWETFGLVMIESMACGTPVAAYPVDGPIDVVDVGVTGHLHVDLHKAIDICLTMNRVDVEKGSRRWTWDNAWNIFKHNLLNKEK